MNREQALEALKTGKKLTHRLFLPEEYIYLKEGITYSEDGERLGDLNSYFWKIRTGQKWQENWSVYQPKEVIYPVYLQVSESEMIKVVSNEMFNIARLGKETSLINHSAPEVVIKDLLKGGIKIVTSEEWSKFLGIVRNKLVDVKLI